MSGWLHSLFMYSVDFAVSLQRDRVTTKRLPTAEMQVRVPSRTQNGNTCLDKISSINQHVHNTARCKPSRHGKKIVVYIYSIIYQGTTTSIQTLYEWVTTTHSFSLAGGCHSFMLTSYSLKSNNAPIILAFHRLIRLYELSLKPWLPIYAYF